MAETPEEYEFLTKKYSKNLEYHGPDGVIRHPHVPKLWLENPYPHIKYPSAKSEKRIFESGIKSHGPEYFRIDDPICSLAPLADYPNLEQINLYNACLTSFKGLPLLKRLKKFVLTDSAIPDFRYFPEFPQLEQLIINIYIPSFKHMPVLPQLKKMEVRCYIKNLQHFPVQPALEELNLSQNMLENFEGMPILPNLKWLDVNDNFLTSFKGLPVHPNLRRIFIRKTKPVTGKYGRSILDERYSRRNNRIRSFEGFPMLPNLEEIVVYDAFLESFQGLPKLPNLKAIDVSHNSLHSLKHLPSLPRLEALGLNYNQIDDLEEMPFLPNLTELDLTGNPIKSCEILETLIEKAPRLNSLTLEECPFETLNGFPDLVKLEKLNLDKAKIKSLKPIKHLKNLWYFRIQETELESLVEMPVLKRHTPIGESWAPFYPGCTLILSPDLLKKLPPMVQEWYHKKGYRAISLFYNPPISELIDRAQHDTLDPLFYPRIVNEASPEIQRFLIQKLGEEHKLSRILINGLEKMEIPIKNGTRLIKL